MNKIVVPVDFREQSLLALNQSISVAKFINAEIVLLFVIESGIVTTLVRSGKSQDKHRNMAMERLQNIAEKISKESEVETSVVLETGRVSQKILETASKLNARFIIMGKNDSDAGLEKYIGTNTTQIISRSNCPVITIKGKEQKIGFEDIVLPLDLTKKTREKVFNAVSFGIHFNSVIWMVSVLTGGIAKRQSRIYAKMKRAQQMIQENGVPCKIKLFEKSEKPDCDVILDYAEEIKADLIMIMPRKEANFREYYIGAFAHEIINRSDIPVLTMIPSDPKKRKRLVKTFMDPFGIFSAKKKMKTPDK